MMEEGSGLESLINQRLTRPSYTRMVSWEFSNQQETNPVKRKRRKSRKQSNVDEEANLSLSSADEDETDVVIQSAQSKLTDKSINPGPEFDVSSSDDDCLYFSAEETISSLSDSDTEVSERMALLDIEQVPSTDHVNGGGQPQQDRRHAPSKKQKRKRRKHDYVLHGDELLSLLEIDIEPDIISETQELVEGSLTCVEKAVPSLVELCLNCTRQRKRHISLPKGLKNMVKHSNKDFTFRKFQVSWLQNEFSNWQPFEKKKTELFRCVNSDEDWGSDPIYKCLLPTRNIWNSVFYPKYFTSYYMSEYARSKTSSILPFTFVTKQDVWPGSYESSSYVFHQRFIGSLATLVDLMMPAVLCNRNVGEEHKSELEQILSATKTAMGRVKGALKVRFSDVTDMFFDQVIPYVFWARGDLQQASALFTKLIDGDKRSRYRAMCMAEIARMHAQLGEPNLACRFYRMASDIALEKGKAMDNANEVNGQMQMLLASVYDQGMMTPNKAITAADHWRYVVTSKVFNRGAANMAAISMLCFHSRPGNVSDTGHSSFVEAKSRLEAMVDVYPKYLYCLSMLQALAGQESDAASTYREFLRRGNADGDVDAPGLRMISSVPNVTSRRQRHNIWHALVAMVTKSELAQPLHVLWRSHLQPLRVCDPSSKIPPSEADLCCDNLDLRLNSQGYLTGNMKTLLPPMRGINLDPYTGKLCFPQTPGRTEPWTSLDRFCEIDNDSNYGTFNNGFIPYPLEVYHHADGTTVQMMFPATSVKNTGDLNHARNKHEAVTFFWSNGNGQSAKLSVLKIFRQLLYERMKQKIMRLALKGKKSEQWQKDCLKLLRHCYDKRREMDWNWIEDVMLDLEEERKKFPPKKLSKDRMDQNFRSPDLLWNNCYTSYGKTLALNFSFNDEYISVFLDCSSREGFLQSKIKIEPYKVTHFGDIPNCRSNKLAGYDIFYYGMSTKQGPCLTVCGQKGKVLEKITQEDQETALPYIIGRSLLMVTHQYRLWCWNDNNIKVDDILPVVESIVPMESSVVIVTLRDRECFRFINTPSLETVPIRFSCDRKGVQITEDGLEIKTKIVKVLTTRSRTGDDHSYQEVILGLDMNLVTLQILQEDARSVEVVITEVLPISGFPVEHRFVGERDGYLLSWTQHNESAKEYKEHVSYFSKDSELLGILPCLGKGPRSFCPLHLPGDTDTQTAHPGYGLPGWYVYMRDGHDGIIGLKLPTGVRTG